MNRALALLSLVLILVPAGCAHDRVTDETVMQWYDVEEDVELGTETLQTVFGILNEKKIPYNKDEKLLAEIRDIVERVAAVSHHPELPWEAHLAEVSEVNAWCAPGGKIMVYRGLFDPKKGLVKTRHELAAILAHECAHATARHVTRARSRQYTLMVSFFPAYLAVAVFAPVGAGIFDLAFNTGVGIYLPSYSRDQEEEADAIGMLYMSKAGYDPAAAVRVWDRAAKKGGSGGGLYSTHPDHKERAEALLRRLPAANAIYTEVRAGRLKPAPAEPGESLEEVDEETP
ncbi:MAG: M48 family metallopeptidase [Planctomycetota bacterium]|jgi:predicted Zn-dependent protease